MRNNTSDSEERFFSPFSNALPNPLCSLTHDSNVIYPREYSTVALNQPFVTLDMWYIIFPARADSEQQFKASSRMAPASAVALGNRPLSSTPLQHEGWSELIWSTPLLTKVSGASGSLEHCSDHDPHPLTNMQATLHMCGHIYFLMDWNKLHTWKWSH